MDYSKLLELLRENMHSENWVESADYEGVSRYALKADVSVSIAKMPVEEDFKVDSNEYASNFIDKTAYIYRYALKYNDSIVKHVLLLSVDGGRALIPVPKMVSENYIQDDDLIISVVIDRLVHKDRCVHQDTVEYLDQAKLSYQDSIIN